MNKRKSQLKILDENAHWWKDEVEQWAIEDKSGNWWVVGGSEFPEKKTPPKASRRKTRKKPSTLMNMTLILLGLALGISLALNVLFFLRFFN